jgi:PAS domain S-box-containing protein
VLQSLRFLSSRCHGSVADQTQAHAFSSFNEFRVKSAGRPPAQARAGMKPAGAADLADEDVGLTALLQRPPGLDSVDALFRNTVEHAPVGIAFANRDGSYRHCNRAFCAMLGYSAEELTGRSMISLTAAEDLATTHSGLEQLWRGDIPHLDIEKRYLRKDGSTLWVRVTTSLVRLGGPEPECSVEFLRDISVRRDIATALMQNQTLLGTLITELPLALLACDMEGRITHHNREAVELFGIPPEVASGESSRSPYPITSEVFLPDGTTPVPRENRPLARALRGDDVRDMELILVRADGAARTTLSCGRRLLGPAGEPLGAVAVVQDITERRRAEEELEGVHRQLLVASRQAGMAEVATNVLHNVGNVLNSVNVSANLVKERIRKSKCAGLARAAELLREHAGDLPGFLAGDQGRHLPAYLQELAAQLIAERDAAVEELAALRSNVEHIKEIVAMQQSYARRGGVTDTVDIRSLVDDSLRMNQGAFSRHGVTIVRDFREVPLLVLDKHKVLQILVNVIRNAKYACEEAPAGGKRITVRVLAADQAVRVSIIDTGVGIPRENLERIFSHGFTTRRDGHGFGLHSSALAARELGGSLEAESEGPGTGATFTLTLPLTAREPRDGE